MDPKRHNILIVDDEEHNLDALRRTFRRKYNIFAACNGEEALRIVQDNKIALVITDQKMPGMTGQEFLQRILTAHPGTIRIVLTGYPDVKPAQDALSRGDVDRYLTKPWNRQELEIVVSEALESYERDGWEKV